jgi:hypothetical protein
MRVGEGKEGQRRRRRGKRGGGRREEIGKKEENKAGRKGKVLYVYRQWLILPPISLLIFNIFLEKQLESLYPGSHILFAHSTHSRWLPSLPHHQKCSD